MSMVHPLADIATSAGPSLRAAVDYVAGFQGTGAPASIAADRQDRLHFLCEAQRGLAPEQAALERIRVDFCEPNVAQRAPSAEPLFAALIRVGGWPDVGYTLCQVVGFP